MLVEIALGAARGAADGGDEGCGQPEPGQRLVHQPETGRDVVACEQPGPQLVQLQSGGFRCPYCGSTETTLENIFGPTPCRSLRYCDSCRQPFEQFKNVIDDELVDRANRQVFGEVFARGFLRAYARAVGLCADTVLSRYGEGRKVEARSGLNFRFTDAPAGASTLG